MKNISAREFEIIAANYAKSVKPKYKWHLTRKTFDYNRDFEAIFDNVYKWGEAKLTDVPSKIVSRNRWDPTLASAILKNNVDEIFLITCGWIPLEYVVRAEHFKNNSIKNIYYVNHFLLNQWLKCNNIMFENFGDNDIDINLLESNLKSNLIEDKKKTSCIINIYNSINNLLEPVSYIKNHILYEINITFFTSEDSQVKISLPDNFKIIDINSNNLSLPITYEVHPAYNLLIKAAKGYSQLIAHGIFDLKSDDFSKISVTIDKKKFTKVIHKNIIKTDCKNELKELIRIENLINNRYGESACYSLTSYGLKKENLVKYDYIESGKQFNYFSYTDSIYNNAIITCRIVAKLLFNFDYTFESEIEADSLVFSSLKFCPLWVSNIIIGCSDGVFALSSLELLNNSNLLFDSADIFIPPFKSINFIDKINLADKLCIKVINKVFDYLKTTCNSTIIIKNHISNNKNKEINNLTNEELLAQKFYSNDKITNIYISNVLDLADSYYNKTNFFKAKFFYEIIYKRSHSIDCFSLKHLFNYADSLNHCSSMKESQYLFEKVANCDVKNSVDIALILEAKTEIANIRFWRMDTNGLIDFINNILIDYNRYKHNFRNIRDKYSFYNCLNRKMVTLYLLGNYRLAEKAFNEYIQEIEVGYENYLAFAYMDSARGLYSTNIFLAKERLTKAINILKKLFFNNKEQRRYFDCMVEIAYVDFIINFESGVEANIENLESAIDKVRNNGYKNMLIKCYLKLATCYLALKKFDTALECLNYVKNNCDFDDNIRAKFLYNSINSSLLQIQNSYLCNSKVLKEYKSKKTITFNANNNNAILLEARVW